MMDNEAKVALISKDNDNLYWLDTNTQKLIEIKDDAPVDQNGDLVPPIDCVKALVVVLPEPDVWVKRKVTTLNATTEGEL